MAANATAPSPEGATPESTTIVLERDYKYIDLSTMELKEKTVKVEFVPATQVEEGLARLTSDENRLKAINGQLKRLALREAQCEAVANGAPRGIILKMAVPFRTFPPYSNMLVLGPNGKPTVESKREQTKAILRDFAQNQMILAMIKAKVAEGVDEEEEEGNTEE